jgi:hypothetical protein
VKSNVDPSVSGDIEKPGQKVTHSLVVSGFHLTHSTDIIRACAASNRFYQVTSLVTNPTIVAALVHNMMPRRAARRVSQFGTFTEKSAFPTGRQKNFAEFLCTTSDSSHLLEQLSCRSTFRVIKTYSSV